MAFGVILNTNLVRFLMTPNSERDYDVEKNANNLHD